MANDTLFRFSEKLEPRMEDGVIYIDNLYENPDAIHDWLEKQDLHYGNTVKKDKVEME